MINIVSPRLSHPFVSKLAFDTLLLKEKIWYQKAYKFIDGWVFNKWKDPVFLLPLVDRVYSKPTRHSCYNRWYSF